MDIRMGVSSLLVVAITAITAITAIGAIDAGDAVADSVADLTRLAVLALPSDLHSAISTATGYAVEAIEVASEDHQITVRVVNSAFNGATRSDRQHDATKVAAAVEREIAARPDLSDVMVVHVDYIRRSGDDSTVVQSLDFRKAPSGRFVLHIT